MKNVLLLETVADEADSILRSNANVIEAFPGSDAVSIAKNQPVHAIVTRGKGQVNSALMDACQGLQVAARCGVGLDNVDVDEATRRNIRVVNAPGSNSSTIAEHALTLMLMSLRNVWNSAERVKAGKWSWRNQYSGDELRGKTLGILGMGNIGQRVAKLADAFGMKVIYWDKFAEVPEFESLSMEDVLRRADIITLHVPLLKDTEKLIGKRELELMQSHALLINTARGPIIDESALIEALEQKSIAGFAADVLAVEPPPDDHPLLRRTDTLITPHTGSLTTTTYRNMCVSTVENVVAILSGGQPDPKSVFNRKELKG